MLVSLGGGANCCTALIGLFAGSFACPLVGLMTALSLRRVGKASRRRSEWNILVHNFSRASVGGLILIPVMAQTLMVVVAVYPRAEQQQVAGDDFSSIFPLPTLP